MSSRSSRSRQARKSDRDADAMFGIAALPPGQTPMMSNKEQIKVSHAAIKSRMKANKLRAIDKKPAYSKKYENQK